MSKIVTGTSAGGRWMFPLSLDGWEMAGFVAKEHKKPRTERVHHTCGDQDVCSDIRGDATEGSGGEHTHGLWEVVDTHP
ncbi:hypothetical protein K1719_016367 [Acacia pycnantha]|nr:hypothetical protein K1719_016367 [Acacia pycnantha]